MWWNRRAVGDWEGGAEDPGGAYFDFTALLPLEDAHVLSEWCEGTVPLAGEEREWSDSKLPVPLVRVSEALSYGEV